MLDPESFCRPRSCNTLGAQKPTKFNLKGPQENQALSSNQVWSLEGTHIWGSIFGILSVCLLHNKKAGLWAQTHMQNSHVSGGVGGKDGWNIKWALFVGEVADGEKYCFQIMV